MILTYIKIMLILTIFQFKIVLSNDYISIPFKKYHSSKNMNSATDKYIKNYLNNNIYINLQISEPKQNISATINSLEFELLMKNVNNLPIENLYSNFSKESSSTFKIISEKVSHFPRSKYVKDVFNFCVNYDINNKKCIYYKEYGNINLIYYQEDETDGEENEIQSKTKKFTYIEIGLNFKSYYNLDNNKYSLLTNLIKNNYIKNNIWFIHFFNQENDNNQNESNNYNNDEGILVFGVDPIEFYNKKYNKDNVCSCQGINKNYDYKNNWSIIFNELKQKTLKPDNKDIIIQNDFQGVINYNYDVIVGNNHYMDTITNTFFWPYLTKEVCQKKLVNNKFYYFECNSISLSLNDIKENFPTLYFKQNEFNYTFELTPQDLFVQIGDKIFFLIVFNKNNPTTSFLLGNIFLKKYFFSFDYNSKKILFYRNDKKEKGERENINEPVVLHWYNSSKIIVIWSFFIVIFCVLGFYFGKRYYKNRKLRANELEDQYDYESHIDRKFEIELKIK